MIFLPILFLFLGIEAQQTAAPLVCQLITDNLGDSHDTLVARLDSVDSQVELVTQAAIGFNKTLNQLVVENETLRNRQAAAAVLQVTQFLMVILYFLMIGIVYLVKCFKTQQAKQLEQNLQEMEERLQERKNKRRSAGRPPKEQ